MRIADLLLTVDSQIALIVLLNALQTAGRADLLLSRSSQPRDLKQKARLRKDPGLCFVLTMPTLMPHCTGDGGLTR